MNVNRWHQQELLKDQKQWSRRNRIKTLRKESGLKVIDIWGQKIDEKGNLLPTYKVEIEGTATTAKNLNDTSA